jgi:hypothetical protein
VKERRKDGYGFEELVPLRECQRGLVKVWGQEGTVPWRDLHPSLCQ